MFSGCLGLPLMFYIISLLWFKGVVPMMLAVNLAIFCYMYCGGCWGYVVVPEAVGMSCGCLGLPLML